MARTRSPLFSSSAHGKLARSLVYSKKKSGQLTRAMHYPKKDPSLKQWTRRHIVGLLTAHWQCMTDNERSTWKTNAAASNLNLPGYQYFLKLAQADLYTNHGLVCYFSFNEPSGEDVFCHVCDMIIGTLGPSYPDNCPIRSSSVRTEYGNALWFDGVDDYVQIDYNSRFSTFVEATFEAWIKLDDLEHASGCIISNWRGMDPRRCWQFRVSENMLQFFCSANGIDWVTATAATRMTTEWTHVVARLNLDDKVHMFINAVQDSVEKELTSFHAYDQDIYVGSILGAVRFFGNIDEVRVYNRALSNEEIKKHFDLLRLDKKRQPLLRL